jgi:hypothetical protein
MTQDGHDLILPNWGGNGSRIQAVVAALQTCKVAEKALLTLVIPITIMNVT